ncbi:hypothetical protein CR970_03335 [Candidatus Saccharibacteria bacterium]|nr:MAG: hypothetical protein CR970_03335 [Candidatus Saccharibacteria bacterium]
MTKRRRKLHNRIRKWRIKLMPPEKIRRINAWIDRCTCDKKQPRLNSRTDAAYIFNGLGLNVVGSVILVFAAIFMLDVFLGVCKFMIPLYLIAILYDALLGVRAGHSFWCSFRHGARALNRSGHLVVV